MEKSILKAQMLFKEKQYEPALEMCVSLLEEGTEDKKSAYLLAAKSYLFCLKTPMNKENNKIFTDFFTSVCNLAETVEEALEFEREIKVAIFEWKAKCIKEHLAALENRPSLEKYNKYFPTKPEYIILGIKASISARNCPAINKFCEENGIEKKDFPNKVKELFGNKYDAEEVMTDEQIAYLEYETAQRMFANTQSKLSNNNNGNAEFMQEVAKTIISELYTAEMLISCACPKKNKNPEFYCNCLIQSAYIQSYMLTAMIYPNGAPMSLFQSGREEVLEKIKKNYAEVVEINPSFVPPLLPNVEAVKPPQASGGCYVATAVYGSYDCPEVWTLRRFRDNTLAETWYGRAFIRTYYAISPTLVNWFGNAEWFKKLWKPTLDKMVKELNDKGVDNTAYHDKKW